MAKPNEKTLRRLVQDYIIKYRPLALKETEAFRRCFSIEVAILNAVHYDPLNGKKHSHQNVIPREYLDNFNWALQEIKEALKQAISFDDLLAMVTVHAVYGIGELAAYDTTHRIGAFLKLEPKLVYLHAGTRIGAIRLSYATKKDRTIDPATLPDFLKVLTPAELEDWFCIYADDFLGDEPKKEKPKCFRRPADEPPATNI
jgi:hypothetical protein